MKKYFYIFTLFFLQAIIAACTDSEIYDSLNNGADSSIKIILNIPVDNGRTRGLIYGPDEDPIDGESVIKDVYALAFEKSSGKYLGKLQSYMSEGALISKININEIGLNELTVVVLTNLKSLENGKALIDQINALTKDMSKKTDVLKSLKYTFNEKWVLADRPLPMWGETDVTPIKESTAVGTINLYRSVSKINVVVNNGLGRQENGIDVFKLKSVRVYYARTSGLVGSLHAPVENEEGSNTIITPSIPEGVGYFPRYNNEQENNLLFEEETEDGSYAIENKIYVPESDQTNTEEPMCLVVGGYYMGSTQETYYRVDFKQGNKGTEFYNAIRNHIYTFNINNVTRPGTDEPDPALDHVVVGMDVSIKDWTTEWMRGIGGQYTLKVNTGGFVLAANNTIDNELQVSTTHNEPWTIENQSVSWLELSKTSEGVIVKASDNNGGERRGTFIIKSGNLQKVITVRQRGKGTANSYIVSDDGSHIQQDLIVTVKGNGEVGLVADGTPLEEKDPYISADKIGDVQLIWETSDGLVSIVKGKDGKAWMDKESGIIKYTIDLTQENSQIQASNILNGQKYKGGNALIGAFGKNGDGSVNYNELLWTWHIWVCPDLDKDEDGYITDEELKVEDETWATGYTFMDRNMGALSKLPGLPSLGLLYQWGRKDPFVGAAKVSSDRNNNRMYTHLPLESQGYYWKNSTGNMNIAQATKSPTTLINGIITGTDYAYLWGTASGLKGETNAGNKTIYDPCPYGYRVPNVAAVVFKGTAHPSIGKSDSENANWYSNNEFWPLKKDGSDGGYDYYLQVTGQSSYGFWLRYDKQDTEPDIKQYSASNPKNIQTASATNRITWLPLSGVYEGDVNQFALLDGQNSLLTNSIMWTNSSVTIGNDDDNKRPAGLFLHGVQSSKTRDGNHFHKLQESGNNNSLYAKPKHAGALRCIRDVKVNMGEENAIKLPKEIQLASTINDIKTEELTSLLDSWEVVDPGAMWFVMTPDAGPVGSKQTLTFKSTQENTGNLRTAYIKIKFNDANGTVKSIKVTQLGVIKTTNLEFAYDEANNSKYGKSVDIGINNFKYSYTSTWYNLVLRQSGSNLMVYPKDNNNSRRYDRTWTITVTDSQDNTIRIINVTQRHK